MKSFTVTSASGRKWPSGLLILLMALATTVDTLALDHQELWTTIASAGVVDEADTAKVIFSDGVASLNAATTPSARAVIRYNVVAVGGLFVNGTYTLTARFRDNGAEARVILRLREYNLNTGVTTTRMTLDSDNFAATTHGLFQRQSVTACSPGWSFDFLNNAYFIEAELSRASVGGTPGLGVIQLSYNVC